MLRIGPAWAVALTVAVLLWSAAIWAAPLATEGRARGMAAVYVAGAVICHQRPDRSFHMGRAQLPVCARCTALYTGGAVGMLAWLLIRTWRREPAGPAEAGGYTGPAKAGRYTSPAEAGRYKVEHRQALAYLAVAAVPAAISVAGSISGWWDGTNLLRAAMSFPFGATVGAVTAAVVARDLR